MEYSKISLSVLDQTERKAPLSCAINIGLFWLLLVFWIALILFVSSIQLIPCSPQQPQCSPVPRFRQSEGVTMFKKRYLFILIPLVLVFTIVAIITIIRAIDEHSQRVDVCRNALSSDRPGYTFYECGSTDIYSPLNYQRAEASPISVTIYFDDGTNDMWCDMQRHGSEWVVISRGSTITAPCP